LFFHIFFIFISFSISVLAHGGLGRRRRWGRAWLRAGRTAYGGGGRAAYGGSGGAREQEREKERGIEAAGARRMAGRPRGGARSKDDGATVEKTTGRGG